VEANSLDAGHQEQVPGANDKRNRLESGFARVLRIHKPEFAKKETLSRERCEATGGTVLALFC